MSKSNTIIELTFKHGGKTEYFKTLTDIYNKYQHKEIGISLPALWNAISPSKGNGNYENKLVTIKYKENKTWE